MQKKINLKDILLTNSQHFYSDDMIQAFKSINNYIRHKALGNVNTVMLAMDLYKSYNDITTMDIVTDSVDSISLMLNRSYEIQSIFEQSESKSSIKEIIEILQKRNFEISNEIKLTANSEIEIRDFLGNVFSSYVRNAFVYRGANKIQIKNELTDGHLKITIRDNGEKLTESIIQSIENRTIFSSKKHTDSDLDLFIANEILKAHEIKMHLEENHPKGGIFSIKLGQRDFSIK